MRRFLRDAVKFTLVCFALTSCAQKSNDASVRLSFPDWNAVQAKDAARMGKVSTLSVDYATIGHVFINISGPGMTTIVRAYERPDNSPDWKPPGDLSIVVPKGPARLIQVLGVFDSSAGGGMVFYYGDVTQTVANDNQVVPLTIQNISSSSATAITEGQIEGRFMSFDAAFPNPTGKFQYVFDPGAGKPKMIVQDGEVFAGWVHMFALSAPQLSYQMNGQPIFQGATSRSAALHDSANPQRSMRITVPAGVKTNSYMDSKGVQVTTNEVRNKRDFTIGYFGPGAGTSRGVCYQNTSEVLNNLYTDSSAAKQPIVWKGSNGVSNASTQAFVDTTAGGVGAGSAMLTDCYTGAGANEWDKYLVVVHQGLSGDGTLPFRGPFAKTGFTNGNVDYMKFSRDAATSTVTVSWNFLPGAAGAIPGVGVFYRIRTDNSTSDDDIRSKQGYRCNELTTLNAPFTEKRLLGSQTSATITGISDSQYSNLQVVVCPLIDAAGAYYGSGIAKTNGASGGGVPTKLAVYDSNFTQVTLSTPASIPSLLCSPIYIKSQDAFGNQANLLNAKTINVAVQNGGGAILYNSSTCATGATSSLSVPTFMGATTVYVMPSAGPVSIAITDSDSSASGLIGASYTAGASSVGNATTLTTLVQANAKQYDCIPVVFQFSNGGVPAVQSAVVTYSLSSSVGVTFYGPSDAACISTTTTTFSTTNTYQTQAVLFARITSSGNVSVIPVYSSGGGGSGVTNVLSGSITASAAPVPTASVLRNVNPGPFSVSTGYKLTFALVDGNGADAPLISSYLYSGSSAMISLSTSTGQISIDGSTGWSTSLNMLIPFYSSGGSFYYRATAAGTTANIYAVPQVGMTSNYFSPSYPVSAATPISITVP